MKRPSARMCMHLFSTLIILTCILIGPSATPGQQVKIESADDQLKLHVNLINLNVSVVDPGGRFIRGLSKDNFEVFEDKTKQNIELFSFEDLPISIGFVFDLSGGMSAKVKRARETLREFVNGCNEEDEMFIIGFNDKPKLLTDFTKNDADILNSVAMMPAKGSTSLLDAVYMGVEKLRQGRYGRKVLIIISDGEDNSSRYSQREIKNLVKESDVEIFSIGTTEIWQSPSLTDISGMEILSDISTMTGGNAYFPIDFKQMSIVCRQIASGLRSQYTLAFVSSNAVLDGGWRKLKIKIKGIKNAGYYSLRARNGYYARQ